MTEAQKNALIEEAKRLSKQGKRLIKQYTDLQRKEVLLGIDAYCDAMDITYLLRDEMVREVKIDILACERQIEATTHQLNVIVDALSEK